MPSGPVIGSLGELLVEFVCEQKDGRNLVPAAYRGPFPSGAPGIFIDQAARCGARAVFAGAVGTDAFGTVIFDRLVGDGVSASLIRRVAGVPTGSAHVSYNSDGSRDFVFNMAHSAAAHFPKGDEAVRGFLSAGCQVLHVSGSALGDPAMRAAVFDVCTALHGAGVSLSIDPNIRTELVSDAGYLQTVRALIALSDYVLPSDADAALLWPDTTFADWSASLSARHIALKRGDKGAVLKSGGTITGLPAARVTVIDPTGAGDCFCGTVVTLLAAGMAAPDALARGVAAGALAVSALGPMEGNATLSTIEAALAGA
ncbi:sugar kinase [Gemmobacter aquarius]|uniref:Sugar kinase n=1 Tax=Paragemmobacter aquarius TaxID=2169400 RepID=A0A2S0UH89_9RHOB|nr:sugar kinase [Gemmobacter aquarius]AWB47187.1 sugar kinase [Gemmobacter aquarius]